MRNVHRPLVGAALVASFAAAAACVGDAPAVATQGGNDGSADNDGAAGDAASTTDGNVTADGGPTTDAGELTPPRALAPLSTATVSSQTPTLKWALPSAGGVDGAFVEICTDRACKNVEQSFSATGESGKVPSALSPGVHFWRLHGKSAAGVASNAGPTWQFFVGHRTAPRDLSWGTAADFDGDGVTEVALAGFSTTEVRVFSKLGPTPGYSVVPELDVDGGLGEQFAIVASLGDLDGDGFPELGVGAYNYYSPPKSGGRVYIYKGGPTGIPQAGAAPTVTVTSPASAAPSVSTAFGRTLVGLGDVDGDGYGDFAVGSETIATADDAGTIYGGVFVYYGGADALTTGPKRFTKLLDNSHNDWRFGAHIGAAGDVNGDGYADLVVSGNAVAAANTVFLGGPGGTSNLRAVKLTPPANALYNDGHSWLNMLSLAPGDLDGDGLCDIPMGDIAGPVLSDGGSSQGRVVVYRGDVGMTPGSDRSHSGEVAGPVTAREHGFSLDITGDVNGDGFDDLVVGAPHDPPSAFFYRGSNGGIGISAAQVVAIPPPTTFPVDTGQRSWAFAVAGTHDYDGDRVRDLIIAPANGGNVYVFRGSHDDAGIDIARFVTLQPQAFAAQPSID